VRLSPRCITVPHPADMPAPERTSIWPLMPADSETWPIGLREDASNMTTAPDEIHGRAECRSADGHQWSVAVTFRLSPEVVAMLSRPPLK
jgi:hypothetical protein